MLLARPLELLGFTLGAVLYLFLAVVLARRRGARLTEQLALAAVSAASSWHAAKAIRLFYLASGGSQESLLAAALDQAARVALALAPVFLLHLSLTWAGFRSARWAALYVAAPAAWWMQQTGRTEGFGVWLGVSLAATVGLCLYAPRRRAEVSERRFSLAFAGALVLLGVALWAGSGGPAVVYASLAPPICFAYFVYHHNLLGLLISRRVVFALVVGAVFAFYLFVVRRVAGFLEDEIGAFGPLTEVALLFAVALVSLPLYGWMTRFLSKRTQLYADFSKRLIEEAARILDLPRRLQFLAEEVGRTFGLRRALLVTVREPRARGCFGPPYSGGISDVLGEIESAVRARRLDMVHTHQCQDPSLVQSLAGAGFNYLFPLWYEDRLVGMLFLDSSPRIFLDEDEAMLLGLSRQISHSIETCRIVEEKVNLEKTLVKQEHLASLGQVAATIAHEIRNPLSSIKTLAQLLLEDQAVAQRYRRDVSYMLEEIDRLNRCVQQLLNFSRPVPEVQTEVDLSGMLESIANMLARQYSPAEVRIEHSIGAPLKLKRTNPELIKQIVLNLMLNAVQASPPGGVVRLEAKAGDNASVCIAVSDQGSGIPVEIREKIFEPFFTTKQKGTGLGLAIVRKSVRHLGGDISVESPIQEGRGTRIVVTLPAE
jgi:signal transduction histidine kinase